MGMLWTLCYLALQVMSYVSAIEGGEAVPTRRYIKADPSGMGKNREAECF